MAITHKRQRLAIVLFLTVATVALFALLPQLRSFQGSWHIVHRALPVYVAVAVLLSFLAYAFSAGVYNLLSYRRLLFRNTLLIQLAGLFVNRVVPAGIGGIGLNYLYLVRQGHTKIQATSIVALNNMLGGVGHGLLLIGALLLVWGQSVAISLPQLHAARRPISTVLLVFAVGMVVLAAMKLIQRRKKLLLRKQLLHLVQFYVRRPRRLMAALLTSCGMTMANVLSFYVCCQAVSVQLSLPIIFIVFTLGVIVGTALPTPGGLGGTEAGLVAGLIGQHVAAPAALAAVLLYRLVSFWPGLMIGLIALYAVQRRQLLITREGR